MIPILTTNNNNNSNGNNNNNNTTSHPTNTNITGNYFSSFFTSNDQQIKINEKHNKIESSPNDIPKEELLQLCMKLNKRLQALENKHSDLTQKNQIITQEHHSILEFLKSNNLLRF